MAQLLLGWRAMRSTSNAASNPWGNSIDDGWRDLVVSSAPPPSAAPPPPPREAYDTGPKNKLLPSDISTWQEHGAARVVAPVEEPSFTAGDRRLWLVAGALMGLAVLVLAVLGVLTFGGTSPSAPAAIEPAPVAATAPTPARAPESARVASATIAAKLPPTNGPRTLKRTKHARHHKRIAAR